MILTTILLFFYTDKKPLKPYSDREAFEAPLKIEAE